MKKPLFVGAGVAIVTPFDVNGDINFIRLNELLEYQISNGTDAIIICGTTGESATLSTMEHIELVKYTVQVVEKRVPVIAGCGSNNTEYATKMANECERCGADGLLMVTPYYNKTSQHGLVEHYKYISDRVSSPIIVYNVPSRTGLNIKPETYLQLCEIEKIVAAKEANPDISSLIKTIELCGDRLDIYCGCDDITAAFVSLGAKGVISVASNVIPRVMHDIVALNIENKKQESIELQLRYLKLCNDLFIDVNPMPVKAALNLMGFDVGKCRLPLTDMSEENLNLLEQMLKEYELI